MLLKSTKDKVAGKISGSLRSVLAIADQFLVSGTNFLSAIIVGRAAGAHELGGFSLAVAAAVTMMVLQESLIIAPYTVFLPRLQKTNKRRYVGAILVQYLVLSAMMAGLLGLVAIGGKMAGMSDAMWFTTLALAAACPGFLLRDFVRRTAFAELRVLVPVSMDTLVAVLQLGGLVLLAWYQSLTMATSVLMVGGVQGLCGVIWLLAWGPKWEFSAKANRALWRKNWRFGRWYSASRMVGMGHTYSLHWLLMFFAGPVSTGLFAAGVTLIALSNPVLLGIGNLLAAQTAQQFSAHGIDALRITLWRHRCIVVVFAVVFAVLVTLLREPLIRQLFGNDFVESATIVPWLAAALVANALGMSADSGLRAMNRPAGNLVASAIGLVTNIAVTVPLLPASPLMAAAWGTFAGSSATAAYRCWAFAVWSKELKELSLPASRPANGADVSVY